MVAQLNEGEGGKQEGEKTGIECYAKDDLEAPPLARVHPPFFSPLFDFTSLSSLCFCMSLFFFSCRRSGEMVIYAVMFMLSNFLNLETN